MKRAVSERQELAEEWRRVGELLQKRSPELFEKVLVMVATSAVSAEPALDPDISEPYTEH